MTNRVLGDVFERRRGRIKEKSYVRFIINNQNAITHVRPHSERPFRDHRDSLFLTRQRQRLR
jgi:hypothetical protein